MTRIPFEQGTPSDLHALTSQNSIGCRHFTTSLFGKNDVPKGHEYSVLNYDHATRMITLRNPWGHQEPEDANGKPVTGKDDGVFTISLTEFNKRFRGLAYTK